MKKRKLIRASCAQDEEDAAVFTAKDGSKQPLKKKLRKGVGQDAKADATEGADTTQQHPVEGWTEIGGLSSGLRKEAARNAKEAHRAKEVAEKEAAATAKEQQHPAASSTAPAAAPSGGIKITHRAHPVLKEQPTDSEHALPPEFLIPDDSMLKPLQKVRLCVCSAFERKED